MSRLSLKTTEEIFNWMKSNKPQLHKAMLEMTTAPEAIGVLISELVDVERDLADAKALNGRLDEIMKNDYGSLVPAGTKIQVKLIGEAKASNGELYVYGVAEVNEKDENCPFVQNKRTSRVFHMPWTKVVKMAVQAGLDDVETKIIAPR